MCSSRSFRVWLCFLLCSLGFFAGQARATAPAAPTGLIVTAIAYNKVALSWIDNSSDETGFQLEIKVGTGAFTALGFQQAANVKDELITGTAANTSYTFRIRAFNNTGAAGATLYSAYSNAPSLTTPAATVKFDAPTSLAGITTKNSVTLNWVDNATTETGFELYGKLTTGSQFSYLGSFAANILTSGPINGLSAATSYDFIVRAYKTISAASGGTVDYFTTYPSVTLVTKDEITSKTGTSSTPGTAFSHTFANTSASTVTSRSLTSVPSTLSFNSSTGSLTGTYPNVGVYTLNYTVNFANGSSDTQTFYIRVRPPAAAPAVGSAIPAWSTAASSTRDTPLAGTFTDVEAESAVRVSTTNGDMDFILFDTTTPATVTNFKNYMSRYANAVFHRSISGFMIQGGGFKGTGVGNNFTSVVTDPPLVNEPGIANERGTVAMAKLGGDPNSATDQFFVSVGDNRSNLDYQNGGFTAFGRVAGNGMVVADAINTLPTNTYGLYMDGSATATSFADFPINDTSAPGTLDQTKLVKINSVTSIPTITYTASSSNPAVVSATIVSGQLHLASLAGGTADVTVTATDLDNLTNTQVISVTVNDSFTTWASRQSFASGQETATQNPDGDALNNLLEYAFMGDPKANSQTEAPTYGLLGAVPASQYMTLTFPVRKFTSGLVYRVETTSALNGPWTTIWRSTDTLNPQVESSIPQADRTIVTIKDTDPLGTNGRRFMRVNVTQN